MRVVVTRKIDELGRVILPPELRNELDFGEMASVDICVNDDNQIVLRKVKPGCKICRSSEDLKVLSDKNTYICSSCRQEISKL